LKLGDPFPRRRGITSKKVSQCLRQFATAAIRLATLPGSAPTAATRRPPSVIAATAPATLPASVRRGKELKEREEKEEEEGKEEEGEDVVEEEDGEEIGIDVTQETGSMDQEEEGGSNATNATGSDTSPGTAGRKRTAATGVMEPVTLLVTAPRTATSQPATTATR